MHPLSRKRNPREFWTSCKLCSCCGKFIVLLRLPEGGRKVCYFKGWDGNPWYVSSGAHLDYNATPHPTKRYNQRMRPRPEKQPETDPFFSLDTTR